MDAALIPTLIFLLYGAYLLARRIERRNGRIDLAVLRRDPRRWVRVDRPRDEPRPESPEDLAARALGAVDRLARERAVELTTELAPELPAVASDATDRELLERGLARAIRSAAPGHAVELRASLAGARVHLVVLEVAPGLLGDRAAGTGFELLLPLATPPGLR